MFYKRLQINSISAKSSLYLFYTEGVKSKILKFQKVSVENLLKKIV